MISEIGSIIKERRKLLKLTQQDLAMYADVSERIIKILEAGNGNPSVKTIEKILDALGLRLRIDIKPPTGD